MPQLIVVLPSDLFASALTLCKVKFSLGQGREEGDLSRGLHGKSEGETPSGAVPTLALSHDSSKHEHWHAHTLGYI
jgi:hypothetical protein